MLHGGGRAAGGERRGERHPVVVAPGSWLGARGASVGRFHGRRCQSAWRRFSVAIAARGGLRSALSSGQRFREERGDGKLIDFEAGPNGGWSRRSSMRWSWKRWRATAVAAWRLESTRTRRNAVRERRSKSIWPPQRRLTEDKDSGGARSRWSPTAHGHRPRCRASTRAVTGTFG
jgi:hypothetical protein